MKYREPSRLEMQVLSVLWRRGASTVREALAAMPDGKARAYTTILSVMQVMEKKGLVSHVAQGNVHVYQARVSRRRGGAVFARIGAAGFRGSAATALQHLLAEEPVSRRELDEIKEIIARHEPGGRRRGERCCQKERKNMSPLLQSLASPAGTIWCKPCSTPCGWEDWPPADCILFCGGKLTRGRATAGAWALCSP